MWAKPTKADFKRFPAMYSTESVKPADKKIVGHFFVASADWYVVEYEPVEGLFFGYVKLNSSLDGEWGYFSYAELSALKVGFAEVDFDKHWQVRTASEVDNINC